MISKKGFSLVEVMIVIIVLGIISAIVFSVFKNLNSRQALSQGENNLLSALNEVRSLSIASKDDASHGIYLKEDSYIIFTGNNYDANNTENKSFPFAGGVLITSGYSQDIIFNQGSGETSADFNIVLSSKDNSASTTIKVFKTGVIQKNAK